MTRNSLLSTRHYFPLTSFPDQNLNLLRQDGRMVILAFLSGLTLPEKSLFAPLLFKRLTIKGTTLRSRSPEYQGELLGRFEKEALPMIGGDDSSMKVSVHEVFPWDKIQDAHKEMEANKNSGKVSVLVRKSCSVLNEADWRCAIRSY
jgi:NADPH:quinone reductase-like Zn-dependent oxidoreductase